MIRNPELVRVIGAQPHELGPRRVYADWLLERADPRGEYISAVLSLAERIDPARRKQAQARAVELYRAHRDDWIAELRQLGALQLEFSKGFVAEIFLPEAQLPNLERMLALEPITHLVVQLDSGAGLAAAMRAPWFARLRHLTLDGDADGWAEALDGTMPPTGLEALVLRGCSGAGLATFSALEPLAPLRRLSVTATEVGDEGLMGLAAGVLRLQTLYAARAALSDEGVISLVESEAASALEHLALGGNELSDASLEAIVASPHLGKLRRLELPRTDLSEDALASLAEATSLRALRSLDLERVRVDDELAARLRKRFRGGLKL